MNQSMAAAREQSLVFLLANCIYSDMLFEFG